MRLNLSPLLSTGISFSLSSCMSSWKTLWYSYFVTNWEYIENILYVFLYLTQNMHHQDLSSQKFLTRNLLNTCNKPISFLANNISSTSETKEITLLPHKLWYIHSSTKFISKPNEMITWWILNTIIDRFFWICKPYILGHMTQSFMVAPYKSSCQYHYWEMTS